MNVPGGVTTTLLWMNSHEDKKRKLDTMLQAEAHRSKFKTKKNKHEKFEKLYKTFAMVC